MRSWIRPLLIVIAFVVVPLPAWSVIVKTKDGTTYKGSLVEEQQLKVVVRLQGSDEEKTIFRFDIEEIINPVKAKDLEKLSPKDVKGYFDLATNLAEFKDDPEAYDTAMRLFLIAGYLNPPEFGYTALMKMSQLATNGEKADTFRAMAYLLDIVKDSKTLQKTDIKENEDTAARDSFLKALANLRRGKTKEALQFADVKGVDTYFRLIPGLMTHGEFVKLCKDNPECNHCTDGRVKCKKCAGTGFIKDLKEKKQMPCKDCNQKGFTICSHCKGKIRQVKMNPLQLQLILQLELLNAQNSKAKLDPGAVIKSDKWSDILVGNQVRPVPVLSLIYLTGYDPRKCVYKGGKWVEP